MLALLIASILTTSFISGVMGMAGGMILIGVLLLILPVQVAMVLHGFTQLCSNGFRALIHRSHVQWQFIPLYFLGAALAFALLTWLVYRPSLPMMLIMIGSMPFLVHLIPSRSRFDQILDISNPMAMLLCGFVVVLTQMVAGVSGPLLGVFFLRSKLSRHEIIATKAATQTFGHLGKVVFYGSLLSETGAGTLPWSWLVAAVVCSFVGARLGAEALKRISNQNFRTAYSWILMAIGLFFMGKGLFIALI